MKLASFAWVSLAVFIGFTQSAFADTAVAEIKGTQPESLIEVPPAIHRCYFLLINLIRWHPRCAAAAAARVPEAGAVARDAHAPRAHG